MWLWKKKKGEPGEGQNLIQIDLVTVPEGPILMGSSNTEIELAIACLPFAERSQWKGHKLFGDEQPQERIKLNAYRIGVHPVTNVQYQKFVESTGYKAKGGWRNQSQRNPRKPATELTWFDAQAFCEWTGFRLPTEAEWEKASRGPDGFIWPWGNKWDPNKCRNGLNVPEEASGEIYVPRSVAIYRDGASKIRPAGPLRYMEGARCVAEIGSYPEGVSPYGCYDMSGNTLEWCSDWFYKGVARVLRGGGFRCCAITARSATRLKNKPKYWNDSVGFRVASEVV